MKSKLLQESPKTYALVFDKGDEVMAGLSDFAKRQRLSGSHFTAIGALSDVTLVLHPFRTLAVIAEKQA
jgi:predicted DNA-binding protein with PD1-like motif